MGALARRSTHGFPLALCQEQRDHKQASIGRGCHRPSRVRVTQWGVGLGELSWGFGGPRDTAHNGAGLDLTPAACSFLICRVTRSEDLRLII